MTVLNLVRKWRHFHVIFSCVNKCNIILTFFKTAGNYIWSFAYYPAVPLFAPFRKNTWCGRRGKTVVKSHRVNFTRVTTIYSQLLKHQTELVCSALIIYDSTLGVTLHRQGVTGCLVDPYRTLKTILQKLLRPTK